MTDYIQFSYSTAVFLELSDAVEANWFTILRGYAGKTNPSASLDFSLMHQSQSYPIPLTSCKNSGYNYSYNTAGRLSVFSTIFSLVNSTVPIAG